MPKPESICVHKLPQCGPNRSIMLHLLEESTEDKHVHGMPVKLELRARASGTAHGRIKVALGLEVDGMFAPACEYRLEMN